MKKGFTLIELLAVIVILAIIALIATPIVLDIIDSARKSSNERILDFLTKVKNPYIFKVNGRLVRMKFSENGPTADECLTNMLENLYR